ncbi:MAG TPA: hypothetical protein GXZ75_03950 [Clostridia bacterium]|nr:hypothetical protein [Clostridia bacterium]
MFSEMKKQHVIIFVLMLSLLFGGGVKYGRYLEKKTLPPVSVSLAEDSFEEGEKAPGKSNPKEKEIPEEVVVHVSGALEKPGVYRLLAQSRVIDVVELARPKADADLNGINLAKKINDQEMIIVPELREEGNSGAVTTPIAGNSMVYSGGDQVGVLININLADQNQLESLPGIGPAKARAIIEYREENGGFSSVEDIQNVSGIGPATFEKLKDKITI